MQRIVVVYVDDGLLLPNSEEKDIRAERVRAMVEDEGGEAAGLSFVSVPIEDAFEDVAQPIIIWLMNADGETAGEHSPSSYYSKAERKSRHVVVPNPHFKNKCSQKCS